MASGCSGLIPFAGTRHSAPRAIGLSSEKLWHSVALVLGHSCPCPLGLATVTCAQLLRYSKPSGAQPRRVRRMVIPALERFDARHSLHSVASVLGQSCARSQLGLSALPLYSALHRSGPRSSLPLDHGQFGVRPPRRSALTSGARSLRRSLSQSGFQPPRTRRSPALRQSKAQSPLLSAWLWPSLSLVLVRANSRPRWWSVALVRGQSPVHHSDIRAAVLGFFGSRPL